jgi:hypothetical protein
MSEELEMEIRHSTEIVRLTARIKELEEAADAVCWFDWSDNDTDAVAAINELRRVLNHVVKPT